MEAHAISTNNTHELEIREIVSQKKVGGKVYFRVDWEPTWMPESDLHGARELINKFVAQLQYTPREGRSGSGSMGN
jgi:hypothetical protein